MERLQDNKRRRRRWGSYCRSSVFWRRRSRRTRVCPETPPDWALCDPVSPLLFLLVAFSLFLRQQQPRDTGFENAPTSSSERSDIECSERGREGGMGGGRRGGAERGGGAGWVRLAACTAARGSREAPAERCPPARRGGAARGWTSAARQGAEIPRCRRRRPHTVDAGRRGRGRARAADPREARPGAVGRVVFPAELLLEEGKFLHAALPACPSLARSLSPTVRRPRGESRGLVARKQAGLHRPSPHPTPTTSSQGKDPGDPASRPPPPLPFLLFHGGPWTVENSADVFGS